jgi:hypothetical protein
LMLGTSDDHAIFSRQPFNHRSGPSIVSPFNPKRNNEGKTLRECV